MVTATAPLPAHATARLAPRRLTPWHGALTVLGLGTAVLTVWGSWAGSRSDYYAAIALSMSKSWPNFFFGALDPAGTVTLDKIPGSYWVPALFVKLFGFSTLSVVLPNALAAVAAAILVAVTAKRMAGPVAGIVAGAVTATTPILVAVARSNQPETFFVLALALVAWAATKALERASLRWLVVAGAFIALAFQCYMLEAWAVWPALAAAYLCVRIPLRRRIAHLAGAGLVSAALSVAWIAIVALIPAGSRPYIGSTLHNSPWEMVFGYNGLGRFGSTTADSSAYNSFTPPYSGSAGVFRLFNTQLAGQIGWMIPAALLAVAILIALRMPARVWVFLGGWLITFLAMFSTVAGMHEFYTAALSVPMGLLIGIAFGLSRRKRMLWPPIVLVTAASLTALGIAFFYGGYSVPIAFVQLVVAAVTVAVLVWERHRAHLPRVVVPVLAIVALLLTPASWAVVTIAHPSSVNPVAGGVSDSAGGGGTSLFGRGSGRQQPLGGAPGAGSAGFAQRGDGGFGGNGGGRPPGQAFGGRGGPGSGGSALPGGGPTAGFSGTDTALLDYVEKNATDSRYLVAVFGAQTAARLIISSDGGSILPIGGFNGGDPVPTLAAFTAMVQAGDIPYVLATSNGGGFFGSGSTSTTSSQIREWVTSNCTEVSSDEAALSGLYRCGAS